MGFSSKSDYVSTSSFWGPFFFLKLFLLILDSLTYPLFSFFSHCLFQILLYFLFLSIITRLYLYPSPEFMTSSPYFCSSYSPRPWFPLPTSHPPVSRWYLCTVLSFLFFRTYPNYSFPPSIYPWAQQPDLIVPPFEF